MDSLGFECWEDISEFTGKDINPSVLSEEAVRNVKKEETFDKIVNCTFCNAKVLKNYLRNHISHLHVQKLDFDSGGREDFEQDDIEEISEDDRESFEKLVNLDDITIFSRNQEEELITKIESQQHEESSNKIENISKNYEDSKEALEEHSQIEVIKCSFCKSFVPRSNIREHTMMHVKPNKKTFKCETCDKSFVDNYKLKVHITSHTGEKAFQCPSCDQTFRLKPMLKRHEDVHHTKTNLSYCDKCSRTFNTKRGLQTHLGSFHGDELGFKCDFCNSRFFSKGGLDAHRQEACFRHTCEKCNKKFKIRYKLKHHKCPLKNIV